MFSCNVRNSIRFEVFAQASLVPLTWRLLFSLNIGLSFKGQFLDTTFDDVCTLSNVRTRCFVKTNVRTRYSEYLLVEVLYTILIYVVLEVQIFLFSFLKLSQGQNMFILNMLIPVQS